MVMAPLVGAFGERADLPVVQIMGGNGSAALLDERTVIDPAAGTIEASAGCDLPRFRPGHSLRDLDILVLSADQDEIDRVEALAEELIGTELQISVFGLKSTADLQRQRRHPVRTTMAAFVSDRYVETFDGGGPRPRFDGFKALYPFRVPITGETLETFHLLVPGRDPVPTPHPGATILNYLTRSISGVRAKDRAKVVAMADNVLTRYPDIREWIHDGPGRTTFELARILHSLRQPSGRAQTVRLGRWLELAPYDPVVLLDHPGFMAADLGRGAQRSILAAARLKSRVVARFEANPRVVTFWQRHVEERVHAIVHNEV